MLHTEKALTTLELPDIATIIDPWLPAQGISLVFGPPSAGKTIWTTSVARALARGDTLFGTFPCQKSRVLIVQADMPVPMYQERLQASAASASDDILIWLTENVQLDVLSLGVKHQETIAKIRDFAPSVIFVDTLRKTHQLDENDSAAPDRVYGAWRKLFPGASFVFLHHTRKVSMQPVTPDVALREAFRGSIAWAASADSIVAIRRVRKKGSKDWMLQQRFVRTRGCEEPPTTLLRKTDTHLLEPVAENTLEHRLIVWLGGNPTATQNDAMHWLLSLRDDKGKELCAKRRAYRIYDRVTQLKSP